MKILQITSRPHNRSGSGIQMMQLCFELAERGHDVTAVYTNAKDERTKKREDYSADFELFEGSKVKLIRLPFNSVRFGFSSLPDVRSIRRLIKQGDFDLIHTHTSAIDFVYLATIGLNIPVIAQRGMSNRLSWGKGIKYRSKRVNRIIAVSEDIKNVMAKTGQIHPDKIEVVYGSVDLSVFSCRCSSNNRGDDIVERKHPTEFTFGTVCTLARRKGMNYTFDAFTRIANEYPQANFVAIGFTMEQLEQEGVQLPSHLKDRVHCLGFQSNPAEYLSSIDTFVFSGTHGEGLTGAIREACSMHVPVISTDVGGNNELIKHLETGLLVPVGDADALYDAMHYALNNDDSMLLFADKAQQFVRQRMSIDYRTDQMLKIYDQVLEG